MWPHRLCALTKLGTKTLRQRELLPQQRRLHSSPRIFPSRSAAAKGIFSNEQAPLSFHLCAYNLDVPPSASGGDQQELTLTAQGEASVFAGGSSPMLWWTQGKVAQFVRSPCAREKILVIFEDPLLQSHWHWTCWTHLMVKRHTDVFRIWTVDNWEDRVSAFWETYNYKQTKNISARTWDRRQQFSWENLGDAWHCCMTGIKN